MKIALFTNPYQANNNFSKSSPSFSGGSVKIPQQINDTFSKLRKEIANISDNQKSVCSVPLIEKADETAKVTVEHKTKNWILSFFFENAKEGRQAEVTHSKGDKKAIQALLKDRETKKELNNFLNENGVDFSAI